MSGRIEDRSILLPNNQAEIQQPPQTTTTMTTKIAMKIKVHFKSVINAEEFLLSTM